MADGLARWTNNRIRSGLNQVNMPHEPLQQVDSIVSARYSCPFSYKAAHDVMISPLPEFIREDQPALYGQVTALEYHQ